MTDFDGATYDPVHDKLRLTTQLAKVLDVMQSYKWITLQEIAALTHAPQASVSAQLRNLRKPKFGNYTVDKRVRGDRTDGLYEYNLT